MAQSPALVLLVTLALPFCHPNFAFATRRITDSAKKDGSTRLGGHLSTIPVPRGIARPRSVTPHSSPSNEDADAPKLEGGRRKGVSKQASIEWPGLMGGKAGPMQYEGGSQMTSPITVHTILYGNWGKDSGISSLESFVKSLSSTDADDQGPSVHKWWNIVTHYTDKEGQGISSDVRWGTVASVDQGYKKSLGDGFGRTRNEIAPVIADQIKSGALPSDPNAIYLFLSSTDVVLGDNVNGFCGFQGYCGWHGTDSVDGTTIQYGVIGDPTEQCNYQCGHNNQMSRSPNGNFRMDSMISTIAHEIAEAATDPDLGKGWIALDADGQTGWENADLCNAVYTDPDLRKVQTDAKGTYAYNLLGVDGTRFLIQALPDLSKQDCMLQAEASNAGGGGSSTGGHRKGGHRHGRKGKGDKSPSPVQSPDVPGTKGGCEHEGDPCSSCGSSGCYCAGGQCLPL